MIVPISEEIINAEFDRRRDEGLISYDDSPEIHNLTFGDFKVRSFRLPLK